MVNNDPNIILLVSTLLYIVKLIYWCGGIINNVSKKEYFLAQ